MSLLPDAKDFWKWWSVHGAALAAIISALYASLPALQAALPPFWYSIIMFVLSVVVILLRVLQQGKADGGTATGG